MSRLFVTGLRSCVFLGKRNETLKASSHVYTPMVRFIKRKKTYMSLIWRRFALGMSRTKIHLTLKTPFHLSDAQTVLLRV